MKILKIQTLRGPNYWSIRHRKLVVLRLDLEQWTEQFTNEIPGFLEGLVKTLPSLIEHRCSPGYRGGFLERVERGTLLSHVVEHVALELQTLAGMKVGFGRARKTADLNIYQVVFEFENERAGRYAARAAVRLCQSIAETGSYPQDEFQQDLQDLEALKNDAALGPSTETLVTEAEQRGIPWSQMGARAMIRLGLGVYQKRIQATLSDHTSILGVELACDKEGTKRTLRDAGIPVPRGTVIHYFDELAEAIEEVGGYPIVIKPLDGNHGRGITIDINAWEEAEEAYDLAVEASKTRSVIVERFYQGRDHRILVVNGKLIAVAERVPARVIGDGHSTIEELIEETNDDPRRGDGHDNVLTKITVDRNSHKLLEKQGYTLDSVLLTGEVAYLRATANLSTGGVSIDRTDEIHPENRWLAERVVRVIGLDIAGLDVVTTDIGRPLRETDGVIVEVNAAPGFRMHVCPSEGTPRNVAAPVMEMLFPPGTPCRIPILAVTGTNGKTTTTRLLAHIVKQTGQVVGYTTTDGTYIGDFLVEAGDNTGPQSAELILHDPTVEIAVLETARGGILRAGIAFDTCDVAAVLNVAADHLGLGDIHTIEEMAHVKSVLVETVRAEGFAILNGDDPLVAAMAERVKAQVAYFSMDPSNEMVRTHAQKGGLSAIYDNEQLCILKGDRQIPIEAAANIPLTLGGRVPFMIANALAASLMAFAHGIPLETIQSGLRTFEASAEHTPGRMNLFDLGSFHVLVDYAHNAAGYEAVGQFVKTWTGKRIGVVGAPGDRRDEDLVLLGQLAARMFDRILVKEDDDTRGRSRGAVADLICQGIGEVRPDCDYEQVLNENTAITKALDSAPTGGLVVIFPESVRGTIELIQSRKRA